MRAMNIQERYDEIAQLSGCSEQVVRRVMRAIQQSLVKSLKSGKNATLPGVCTLYPELRNKIDYANGETTKYIKIKAKASSALETEFSKTQGFNDSSTTSDEISFQRVELPNGVVSDAVVITSPEDRYKRKLEVKTEQLGSLL